MSAPRVPVALFAYLRTDCLERTLGYLRENRVPLIYAFSDGPRSSEQVEAVEGVRRILRAVDWAEVRLVERPRNLGLGVSIRSGVEEVLAEHDSLIVFEDDLECIPGTYDYLCEALDRYRGEPAVLSVTGWTHPRTTPAGVDSPYFDGRTECLVWGTWRRAWKGMDKDASTHMQEAIAQGIDPARYGDDLVEMARSEKARNVWAVRWSFLHIARRGLCLRPPHSLVTHAGLDAQATNAGADTRWLNDCLGPLPAQPIRWPEPAEHPDCPGLWQRACSAPRRDPIGTVARLARRLRPRLRRDAGESYPSFAEASRHGAGTYEGDELERFRIERARLNAQAPSSPDLSPAYGFLLLAVHLSRADVPEVVDFGGACGEWGLALRRDARRGFGYSLVESPSMARRLSVDPSFAWLRCSDRLPESFDVFNCSGTLQYLEDPYSLLRQAFRRAREFVVLGRNSFCEVDVYRIQHSALRDNGTGGSLPPGFDASRGVSYVHRTVSLDRVLRIANGDGWEVFLQADSGSGVLPWRGQVFGRDLLLTRKSPLP